MITFLKMKYNELRIKAMFYNAVANILDNQKEIIGLFYRLFTALKDVPAEELRKEFIKQLAEIIHAENEKEP